MLTISDKTAVQKHALGCQFEAQGRNTDALAAYDAALACDPKYAASLNNKAGLLKQLGRLSEAEKACHAGIEVAPHLYELHSTLGNVLTSMGRIDEALAEYKTALGIRPDCQKTASNMLLCLNYAQKLSPQEIYQAHRNWAQKFADPLRQKQAFDNLPRKGRRLRIGYVSGDFRRHSVAFFIEPVIHCHNKDKFEIFCYSDVCHPDEITGRIRGMASSWREISKLDDASASELIRKDRIDVLIDLAGHSGCRLLLFARKPAPVQIAWLGYPNTTGLAAMDYRISDDFADPPSHDAIHSEKLLRLPSGFIAYAPPEDAPPVAPLPCDRNGFFSFGSFNALSKINEQVVAAWAAILKSAQNSRLVLKNISLGDESVRNHLLGQFATQGISTERLTVTGFAGSMNEHLGFYNEVDLAFDTFPYNGTTTTCEALWMGVPSVSLAGDRHAACVGQSILSRTKLAPFAVKELAQYVATACHHAQNPELLRSLRPLMRNLLASSALCNAQAVTANLEDACSLAWDNYEKTFIV